MSDLTDMHNERLIQVNAELRAEVARLQAELRVAYQLPLAVEHAADAELRADNARLRADHATTLDRIEYALRSHQSVIGAACKGCLELALERGRRALEGK